MKSITNLLNSIYNDIDVESGQIEDLPMSNIIDDNDDISQVNLKSRHISEQLQGDRISHSPERPDGLQSYQKYLLMLDTSKKESPPMLSPRVNLNASKRIKSFTELLDCEEDIFCISARMIDYIFEGKHGMAITTMADMRHNFVKFLCTAPKCDFVSSFDIMIPKISKILVNHSFVYNEEKKLTCPKCSSSLEPYLSIQITLLDDDDISLISYITSPEIHELIGCTDGQLLFSSPANTDICLAFHYSFDSYCPYRRCSDSISSSSSANQKKKRQKTEKRLFHTNPQYDWILQCIKTSNYLDTMQHSQIFNSHLFINSNPSRIFYVRGILNSAFI